ncbi:MAG: ankyrin repeat domain-containing protein [Candidatus Methylacidiphilales bacterium]|nr:ankyrin repeat domain-containing protein [Candidatus Methylacidiphilales bacterium]
MANTTATFHLYNNFLNLYTRGDDGPRHACGLPNFQLLSSGERCAFVERARRDAISIRAHEREQEFAYGREFDREVLKAISAGKSDRVRYLLAEGASPDAMRSAALALACRLGHLNIARLLLTLGAEAHYAAEILLRQNVSYFDNEAVRRLLHEHWLPAAHRAYLYRWPRSMRAWLQRLVLGCWDSVSDLDHQFSRVELRDGTAVLGDLRGYGADGAVSKYHFRLYCFHSWDSQPAAILHLEEAAGSLTLGAHTREMVHCLDAVSEIMTPDAFREWAVPLANEML